MVEVREYRESGQATEALERCRNSIMQRPPQIFNANQLKVLKVLKEYEMHEALVAAIQPRNFLWKQRIRRELIA
jgi:hypothetical protein